MRKALRLLHTADWHLGKTLKGVDRTPEIAQALEGLLAMVRSEGVDLLLVSGDLLDHPQPSAEAEGLLVTFFLRLRELGVPALVIGGNHDSGERLERVYRPLLEPLGALVRGRVALGKEGVVEMAGVRAALVPFLSERLLVKALELPPEERHLAYAEKMRRLLAHYQADLVLAHLTVAGARAGGGEYILYLADHYAVPPQALPPARYLALGHLHTLQQAAENAWYPGSLIALDFGSGEGQERGALLVELPLEAHLPARVHPLPQAWGKPLRTFHLKEEELPGRLPEVEGFPGWARAVLYSAPGSPWRDTLRAMPHVLEVVVVGSELPSPLPEPPSTLEAAYERYLEEQKRPSPELVRAFAELRLEVQGASPEA